MKKLVKQLFITLSAISLTACSMNGLKVDESMHDLNNKGVVVLSFDFPKNRAYFGYVLQFKNISEPSFLPLDIFRAGKDDPITMLTKEFDFKTPHTFGELQAIKMEPGTYKLVSWRAGSIIPDEVKNYSFELQAGEILYLGNFYFNNRNLLRGWDSDAPLVNTKHSDNGQRDIKALSLKYPNLDLEKLRDISPKNDNEGIFSSLDNQSINVPALNTIYN